MSVLLVFVAMVSGAWQAFALSAALASPLDFCVRLLVVGSVLTLAAMFGHLLPVTGGWAMTYFASVWLLSRRRE
jgi:uncharacterized membrane protein